MTLQAAPRVLGPASTSVKRSGKRKRSSHMNVTTTRSDGGDDQAYADQQGDDDGGGPPWGGSDGSYNGSGYGGGYAYPDPYGGGYGYGYAVSGPGDRVRGKGRGHYVRGRDGKMHHVRGPAGIGDAQDAVNTAVSPAAGAATAAEGDDGAVKAAARKAVELDAQNKPKKDEGPFSVTGLLLIGAVLYFATTPSGRLVRGRERR